MMNRADPILSIVLVNHNGTQDTLNCIDSLYQHPPRVSFEVILVDNRSDIPCLPPVQRQYPQVRLFEAPQRQGFARNYNFGMRQARGEYVIILNNDMLIPAGALDKLLQALQSHPEYGMVGAKLLSPTGRVQADCARSLPTPALYLFLQTLGDEGLPLGKLLRQYLSRQTARRRSGPVPCITGACMMLSRETLATVGMLDEGYSFYYEDVEWCHRVQQHGRQVAYIAEAAIIHLGDQSSAKVRIWAKQNEYHGALRYFRQYYQLSPLQEHLLWLATVWNYLLRGLLFLGSEILCGKTGYARSYLYLWHWILHEHPHRQK
jgi:N-acetylglucosaminyl-diphospho-decaprenol L-rhamnosyltransferase